MTSSNLIYTLFFTALITFGCSFMAQVCRYENIDRIAHRDTQLLDKAKFIRFSLYQVSVNNENGVNEPLYLKIMES